PSIRSLFCIVVTILHLLAISSKLQAQQQASCAFSFFQISFKTGLQLTPFGINDFATVVGAANDPNQPFQTGFIRWSNGGVNLFTAPKGPTLLYARNDNGISLGLNSSNGVILNGAN